MIVTTYEGYNLELISEDILIYASAGDFYNGIRTPEYIALVTSYGIAAYGDTDYFLVEDIIPGRNYPNAFVGWRRTVFWWTSRLRLFRKLRQPLSIYPDKPCYADFINGYNLDTKTKKPENIFTLPLTSDLNTIVSYYRQNTLESFPDLKTIDWVQIKVNLKKYDIFSLDLTDIVLGTLMIDSILISNLIKNKNSLLTHYPNKYYFNSEIQNLFNSWQLLYQQRIDSIPVQTQPQVVESVVRTEYLPGTLHRLAANNNCWNNDDTIYTDLNFDPLNQLCIVNELVDYNHHIKEQEDGSTGSLVMDSPRTKDIWFALEAWKYSVNSINVDKPRVTTLAFLIENTARVNGLRFDDNGDIDLELERDLYRHRTIENPSLGLPSSDGRYNDYSVSCFGKIGMIVPHLPTTYKKGGKATQLFDVVHDNQQLAIAILRQLDVALSIQHGSEIRLRGLDGKVQAYPNQLAVQLECLQRLEKIGYQTDKNLLVSTVTGTEVRELFSGIGIPVTQKTLSLTDPKNSKASFSIPYFGHQKNKPSTAELLTTVQINLAVINGVLMPKKQPQASITNPFKRFTAKK